MYTVEIVKDKFWILEDAGIKLGTLRRTKSSDFEVIIREDGVETLSLNALTSKFGSKILESKQVKKLESVEYGKDIDEVEGYPSKHRAFNKALNDKNIPVYTKTEKSNVLSMSSSSDVKTQTAMIELELELYNLDTLSRVITKLSQVEGVSEARRL